MDRNPRQLLPRVALLACPFCLDGTSNLFTDGARAGALVLALVAAGVLAGIARFAWRLVKAERHS